MAGITTATDTTLSATKPIGQSNNQLMYKLDKLITLSVSRPE
jgi:hypothetical protein